MTDDIALVRDELLKARRLLEIDDDSSIDRSWRRIDEAELRLYGIMPRSFLQAEMTTQFARAERAGVVGRKELKGAYDVLDEAKDPSFEQRRMIGLALLQRMYIRYGDRRIDRRERMVVDKRMVRTAAIVIGGLFLLTLVLTFTKLRPDDGWGLPAACLRSDGAGVTTPIVCDFPMLWLVVVYFGVVGAFFSRFIEYRSHRLDLTWEDLKSSYSLWVTVGRLMIGAIGALLFYFLMRGNLLAGQLFLTDKTSPISDDGQTIISGEFFRLLVWSTIAGFTERLVPDRFTELASGTRAASAP